MIAARSDDRFVLLRLAWRVIRIPMQRVHLPKDETWLQHRAGNARSCCTVECASAVQQLRMHLAQPAREQPNKHPGT